MSEQPSLLTDGLNSLRRMLPRRFRADVPVVPVVRLSGVIGFSTPLRPGLTLSSCAKALDRAFTRPKAKAVALVINSPGGSAVQSHMIFKRIRQLAEEKAIPVIAFVEDVGASGGYMIACAADEIIVDETSIVGSIGVVGGSFGFHKLLDKIGVERRLYTAGEHKAMLDPFLPENQSDVERLKAIQREIHDAFIALVKARRGPALQLGNDDLFSGAYWTGRKAVELGLADQTGDLRSVLRARFGDKVDTPLVTGPKSFFGRSTPGIGSALFSRGEGLSFADDLVSAVETRAIWARFGL
jgi:serine protease SohB